MRLLIDADTQAYVTAIKVAERIKAFPEADATDCLKSELAILDDYIGDLLDIWAPSMDDNPFDEPPTCELYLSGDFNFRKLLWSGYKAKRGPKPDWLNPVRLHLFSTWGAKSESYLEADDMIGLEASRLSKDGTKDYTIISIDKDLDTIAGRHYNPMKVRHYTVTPHLAVYNHMTQTITGDSSDGYPGIPKVGLKGALKILGEPPEPKSVLPPLAVYKETLWNLVQEAYLSRGLTEEDSYLQARLAYILGGGYFPEQNLICLWRPYGQRSSWESVETREVLFLTPSEKSSSASANTVRAKQSATEL